MFLLSFKFADALKEEMFLNGIKRTCSLSCKISALLNEGKASIKWVSEPLLGIGIL